MSGCLEIFAEDCSLLSSFRKFLPLSRFQATQRALSDLGPSQNFNSVPTVWIIAPQNGRGKTGIGKNVPKLNTKWLPEK